MIRELENTDGPLEFLNNPPGKRLIKMEQNVDDSLKQTQIVNSGNNDKTKI